MITNTITTSSSPTLLWTISASILLHTTSPFSPAVTPVVTMNGIRKPTHTKPHSKKQTKSSFNLVWSPSSAHLRLGHKFMPSLQGWGRVRNFCQELFKFKPHPCCVWPSFCQVLNKSHSVVTAALFSLAHTHLPASPSSRKCTQHLLTCTGTPTPAGSSPQRSMPKPQHRNKGLLHPSWALPASLSPVHSCGSPKCDHPTSSLSQSHNGSYQLQHTWTSLVSLGTQVWKTKNYHRSDSDFGTSCPWVTGGCSLIQTPMIGKREQVIAAQTPEEYGVCLGALSRMYFLQQKAQWGIAWHFFIVILFTS